MKRQLAACVVVVVFVSIGLARLRSQELGTSLKENLDLPFDVSVGSEDEDAPGTVVLYGQSFEGDGFFFCIDRSEVMSGNGCPTAAMDAALPNSTAFAFAKSELAGAIAALSARTRFAIVFFDDKVKRFPAEGRSLAAEGATKSAAIDWIRSIPHGSYSSCMLEGFDETLRIANETSVSRKAVIYIGSGRGHCGDTLEGVYLRQMVNRVTQLNTQRLSIHCIAIAAPPYEELFLRELALRNHGTFRNIGIDAP